MVFLFGLQVVWDALPKSRCTVSLRASNAAHERTAHVGACNRTLLASPCLRVTAG